MIVLVIHIFIKILLKFNNLNKSEMEVSIKRLLCVYILLYIATTLFVAHSGIERFTGTWIASIEYNRSFDTYEIKFLTVNRCNVKINNNQNEQETTGTWS